MTREPVENEICQSCPLVRDACRKVWRENRKHQRKKPVIIPAIVKFAVQNGADMKCLRGEGK